MQWWSFRPTQESTPSEYRVLIWTIVGLLIVMGSVLMMVARKVPPEKHELALQMATNGRWALGIGLFLAFVIWLFRRLTS